MIMISLVDKKGEVLYMTDKGNQVRPKVVVSCGESRTKQSFRDQVNINTILEKFRKTGMVSHLNGKRPFYGDVSDIKSYQEALGVVSKANELFSSMSSKIRERFMNDPVNMVNFLSDPKNIDEAVELGMVIKKQNEEVGAKAPVNEAKPNV